MFKLLKWLSQCFGKNLDNLYELSVGKTTVIYQSLSKTGHVTVVRKEEILYDKCKAKA